VTTPAYKYPTSLGPTWLEANVTGIVPSGRQFTVFAKQTAILGVGLTSDLNPEAIVRVELTSAERMSIVSTSINDSAPSGSGAHLIFIEGLDNSFNLIQEIVALNGTTPVLTVQTFIRINSVLVITSGGAATTSNLGNITLTAEVALTLQRSVTIGEGRDNWSHYTTPVGVDSIAYQAFISVGKNDECEIILSSKLADSPESTWTRGTKLFMHESPAVLAGTRFAIPPKIDTKLEIVAISNNPRAAATVLFVEQGIPI